MLDLWISKCLWNYDTCPREKLKTCSASDTWDMHLFPFSFVFHWFLGLWNPPFLGGGNPAATISNRSLTPIYTSFWGCFSVWVDASRGPCVWYLNSIQWQGGTRSLLAVNWNWSEMAWYTSFEFFTTLCRRWELEQLASHAKVFTLKPQQRMV